MAQTTITPVARWCLVLLLMVTGARADDTAKPPFAGYSSVSDCALCHSAQQVDVLPFLNPDGREKWILYEEFSLWQTRDKHLDAFAVLAGKRAQDMARLMGLPAEQLQRDKRCLTCHASLPLDEVAATEGPYVSDAQLAHPQIQGGVTCEGCHGRSGPEAVNPGDHPDWNYAHRRKDTWRFQTPEFKAGYGFYDVRTPSSQARLCLSCHLGDASQGRVITHDMYAAGHPPLNGFELRTFSAQMPLHWRELEQKAESVRVEFCDKTKTTCDPKSMFRTKSLLVGAVVSLEQALKLALATSDGLKDLPDNLTTTWTRTWPELAQFECFACHHELRTPGWRQQTANYVPGRPQLRGLPLALIPVALLALDEPDTQYRQQLKRLEAAFNARPFGEPTQLKSAATDLIAWCRSTATRLDGLTLSADKGPALLAALCEQGQTSHLEYDAARQLAWAIEVITLDLTLGPADRDTLPAGNAAQELLAGWRDTLQLDLPARAPLKPGLPIPEAVVKEVTLPTVEVPSGLAASTSRRTTYEVNLPKTLPPIGRYDLLQFRSELRKFAELNPSTK